MSQGNPKTGELYHHFKDKMYQITAIATHSETGEQMVVYQALYGDYRNYVRPYDMFISEVDHEKYPEVSQKFRFQLVEPKSLTGATEQIESASVIEETEQNERRDVASTQEETQGVNPLLLRFLDEDDFDKKYDIVCEMAETITDSLIDNLAASIDVVIDEGSLEERYTQLKYCVRTRGRFRTNRFR